MRGVCTMRGDTLKYLKDMKKAIEAAEKYLEGNLEYKEEHALEKLYVADNISKWVSQRLERDIKVRRKKRLTSKKK